MPRQHFWINRQQGMQTEYVRFLSQFTACSSGQFNPYLTLKFWALPVQQQIKIWCQKYWQMGMQFSDRVENIVGKEEIACYERFLLFPQCFQKLSIVDVLKWVFFEWRVNNLHVTVKWQNATSPLLWFFFLTHSHTMTYFDAPGKQAFWKHCGKRRNCS